MNALLAAFLVVVLLVALALGRGLRRRADAYWGFYAEACREVRDLRVLYGKTCGEVIRVTAQRDYHFAQRQKFLLELADLAQSKGLMPAEEADALRVWVRDARVEDCRA